MSEVCATCVLKNNPDSEVLYAVGSVMGINAKHGNGFDWIQEAESMRNYPIPIPVLHELGSTALKGRHYNEEMLALASKCAALRSSGACNGSEA